MIEDVAEGGPAATVRVKVVPGARRSGIAGPLGAHLKIRVSAPPEDGRANDAVCKLIASAAGVRPRDVEIRKGLRSSEKTVLVRGLSAAQLRALLAVPGA